MSTGTELRSKYINFLEKAADDVIRSYFETIDPMVVLDACSYKCSPFYLSQEGDAEFIKWYQESESFNHALYARCCRVLGIESFFNKT